LVGAAKYNVTLFEQEVLRYFLQNMGVVVLRPLVIIFGEFVVCLLLVTLMFFFGKFIKANLWIIRMRCFMENEKAQCFSERAESRIMALAG
jgi:hypothetical protein